MTECVITIIRHLSMVKFDGIQAPSRCCAESAAASSTSAHVSRTQQCTFCNYSTSKQTRDFSHVREYIYSRISENHPRNRKRNKKRNKKRSREYEVHLI